MKQPLFLVAAWLVVGGSACSDEHHGPTEPEAARVLVVSEPVASVGAALTTTAASATASLTDGTVYVSLESGRFPTGVLAVLRSRAAGLVLIRPIVDGGMDPVLIDAPVGTAVDVEIRNREDAVVQTLNMTVPSKRRPRVVRTIPPRRKVDVPLNARIMVVFSEPIRASSAATIVLRRAGASVSGRVVLAADGLRAEFLPDQPLGPNTGYVLSIPAAVADLVGDTLEQTTLLEFTTGTLVAVASIITDEGAVFTNVFNGQPRTFEMDAILYNDGGFTGSFKIHHTAVGTWSIGRVTCFSIRDGKAAWIAGVIDESSNPDAIGLEWGWRAVDNGPPNGGVPDRLSLSHPLSSGGLGTAQHFCAGTPVNNPLEGEIVLHDLLSGDIVVTGTTPVLPPPAPPVLLPVVAFTGHVNDNTDIYLTLPDGTFHRMTHHPNADMEPAWSADGARIAFRSERDGNSEIYVMAWGGEDQTRLTTHLAADYHPAWSPDGSRIAFVSERDGNAEIYVMSANGSNVARVTSDAAKDLSPSWSPSGDRIAFSSERDGNSEIYVMNADGSNLVRLTNNTTEDVDPAWSPDGSKLAFSRFVPTRGSTTCVVEEDNYNTMCRWDILVMNADGSAVTRMDLPTAADPRQPDGWWRSVFVAKDPTWSPDGKQIAAAVFMCLSDFSGADCHDKQPIVLLSATGIGGFVELKTGLVSADHRFTPIEVSPAWRPTLRNEP